MFGLRRLYIGWGRALDAKDCPNTSSRSDLRSAGFPDAWHHWPSSDEFATIAFRVQGEFVVQKPPGWEVDVEDFGGARRLSDFIAERFSSHLHPLTRDASKGFGILHRLDTRGSGLLLCALTYGALHALQWQLNTQCIARHYAVVCQANTLSALVDMYIPIYRLKRLHIVAASERGQPAATTLATLCHLTRVMQEYLPVLNSRAIH